MATIHYHKYDPAASQHDKWAEGGAVPRVPLARLLADRGRVEAPKITEMMANCFRSVMARSPSELLPVVCLATNKIAPAYAGLELGIGDSIMIKAVAETVAARSTPSRRSSSRRATSAWYALVARQAGDVAEAEAADGEGVLGVFREIAQASGNKVMELKKNKVKAMLVAAQEKEAQYIVRALQGKMRIGLAEQTVLVALAHAAALNELQKDGASLPKGDALQEKLNEAEATVKQVYCEMPNYEVIVPALLEHGLASLHDHAHLTPGVPVKPMLAKPTKGISEVLDRFDSGRFTCEYKYDGERAQVHLLPNGDVKIFSRNSEDMTGKYPDVIAMLPRAIKPGLTSVILDCEAVAIDTTTGEIRPFQVLSTRKRKAASVDEITVKVCLYAFDLLLLNGDSYLQKPLTERRDALHAHFTPLQHEFAFAVSSDANDVEAIGEFLTEAVKGNCEGLMVKTLDTDATYEPSKRSLNWLKVKKDYLQGMTDSCDLVPIGGYFGKGKRTGVYGAYLLACYNPDEETYQSICKIGTGFSDESLQTLAKGLNEHKIEGPRRTTGARGENRRRRLVRGVPGVGGARGGPLDLAGPHGGGGARRPGEGHRAPLPALPARAR